MVLSTHECGREVIHFLCFFLGYRNPLDVRRGKGK